MWLWSESDVVHCPGFAQVEEFVASVARLFEEVICLRSVCLVGVAPDLGFVPVFPPEDSTSVACGR